MAVYLPQASTFKFLESPLSNAVAREIAEQTQGESHWGKVCYLGTLLLTPLTILVDIVKGVAEIALKGAKGELDRELFWEISDQHFFIYPFQQLIFCVFSLIGSIYCRNYVDGYQVGQQCVIEFSAEVYQGSPEIFNKVYYAVRTFEPFPGYNLQPSDRERLKAFKEEAARFSDQFSRRDTLPSAEGSEIASTLMRLKTAETAYQIFCDRPPSSMHEVSQSFSKMKSAIKQAALGEEPPLQFKEEERVLRYLHCAYDTLSTFFHIPHNLRMRLLAPNPKIPGLNP